MIKSIKRFVGYPKKIYEYPNLEFLMQFSIEETNIGYNRHYLCTSISLLLEIHYSFFNIHEQYGTLYGYPKMYNR